METFGQVNLLGVLISGVAGFMVGGLWYSLLFAKAWMAELKWDENTKPRYSPAIAMSASLVSTLVVSYFLAFFVHFMTIDSLKVGIMFAGTLAIGVMLPPFISDGMFRGQNFRLSFIDAGHRVVATIVMVLTYIMVVF